MLEKWHTQSGFLSSYRLGNIAHKLLHGAKIPRKASPVSFLLLLLVLITISVLLRFQPVHDAPSWTPQTIQLVRPRPISSPPGSLIPPKIWQILLPHDDSASPEPTSHQVIEPSQLVETPSWLAQNPDHAYKLVTSQWASSFVDKHLSAADSHEHRQLAQIYHALPNPGLKSDLLRYLILSVEGGVYTDIDTIALQPIDEWLPGDDDHDDNDIDVELLKSILKEEQHEDQKIGLIVGIEFDQRDGLPWADIPHPLQFCQWTIASAPRHPVFDAMLARVFESLLPHFTSASSSFSPSGFNNNKTDEGKKESVSGGGGPAAGSDSPPSPFSVRRPMTNWKPTSFEVMNSTGPAAWTDVVFAQLQRADPTLTDLRNLSGITGSRLYGDILVLGINGFGIGQAHSGSTNDGSFPKEAFVKHNFRGSWREPPSA